MSWRRFILFVLCHPYLHVHPEPYRYNSRYLEEDDNANVIIQTPDAGRRFQLGQLYDARTELMIPAFLWPKDLIDANTKSVEVANTKARVSLEDTYKARAELLNIDISVNLAQIVNPSFELEFSGSFKYLSDKKSSSKSVRYATSFSTRTKAHTLDVFSSDLLSPANINTQPFDLGIGTHFVSSVTYGANVVCVFEGTYTNSAEAKTLALSLGGKLDVPKARLSVEASGAVTSNSTAEEMTNNTKVSIFGDLRVTDIPNTVDSAIEFMGNLPELTDTMGGDGVPMDIILTPLSWVDNKAAKLSRRIIGETLNRLVQIYDSFDQSDAEIRDTLAMPYGGFKAWKSMMDNYYLDFRYYRADFSMGLGEAVTNYKDGNVDASFLIQFERDYHDPAERFNQMNIFNKLQEEEDIISNLMALASEFNTAGITFAEELRQYLAPTFDTRFERVYALIMVGMRPSSDRPGIARIREFIKLARAHYRPGFHDISDHCVFNVDIDDNVECYETQRFIAIHFDSFCSDFCNGAFCISQPGEETLPLCPTRLPYASAAECEQPLEISTALSCSINDELGNCGDPAYPDHDITNDIKPFSDCWCACPQTQVVEFVRNRAPERLTLDMPFVPAKPTILSVTTPPAEDDPFNQFVTVRIETPVPAHPVRTVLNYAVKIETTELVRKTGTEEVAYMTEISHVYTKNDNTLIKLEKLVAGETYKIEVAGMNKVGIGAYDEFQLVTVSHRMPTVVDTCVLPFRRRSGCSQPDLSVHTNRTIPAWTDSEVTLGLSTKPSEQPFRVTMHSTLSEDMIVDDAFFYSANQSNVLAECNFAVEGSYIRSTPQGPEVKCTFELKKLYQTSSSELSRRIAAHRFAYDNSTSVISTIVREKMPVTIAFWDSFGVLIGKGQWYLILPSSYYCQHYGANRFFCDNGSTEKCVHDCLDCGDDYIASGPTGHTCTVAFCRPNEIYCPVSYQYRPELYKEEFSEEESKGCFAVGDDSTDFGKLCESNCHLLSTPATFDGVRLCVPPCQLELGGNLEATINPVRRGENTTITCKDGFVIESGSEFFFACQDISEHDKGRALIYDNKRIQKLESHGYSDMSEKGLVCSVCGAGQYFDNDIEFCKFIIPERTGENFIEGGSFVDVSSLKHWRNWPGYTPPYWSRDISADVEGGSLLSTNRGSVFRWNRMVIEQYIFKYKTQVGAEEDLVYPPQGSEWAASVRFKVSNRDYAGTDVGRIYIILGNWDDYEYAFMIVPKTNELEWQQTVVRMTMRSRSYVRVLLYVYRNDVSIDMVEFYPVKNVVETSLTVHERKRYVQSEIAPTQSEINSSSSSIDGSQSDVNALKATHRSTAASLQNKDAEQDTKEAEIKSSSSRLMRRFEKTVKDTKDTGKILEKHRKDKEYRCSNVIWRSSYPKTCTDKFPKWPTDFKWSNAGVPRGYQCTQIREPSDPHTWHDNYFCFRRGKEDPGMKWRYNGPISGMRCTQIIEPSDPHTWRDNYLCVPKNSYLYFTWSYRGPIRGKKCIQWREPSDPHTWHDNYLCA